MPSAARVPEVLSANLDRRVGSHPPGRNHSGKLTATRTHSPFASRTRCYREHSGVVGWIDFNLVAVGADRLAEVALLVK